MVNVNEKMKLFQFHYTGSCDHDWTLRKLFKTHLGQLRISKPTTWSHKKMWLCIQLCQSPARYYYTFYM